MCYIIGIRAMWNEDPLYLRYWFHRVTFGQKQARSIIEIDLYKAPWQNTAMCQQTTTWPQMQWNCQLSMKGCTLKCQLNSTYGLWTDFLPYSTSQNHCLHYKLIKELNQWSYSGNLKSFDTKHRISISCHSFSEPMHCVCSTQSFFI